MVIPNRQLIIKKTLEDYGYDPKTLTTETAKTERLRLGFLITVNTSLVAISVPVNDDKAVDDYLQKIANDMWCCELLLEFIILMYSKWLK